ncbi:hypothetical protein, partial [Nocardia cyriacigeorgica]|uniref:hypothetical protein n=1 Tax=Nocardia cyriacigeorgica TaxID=135487 RepID=UPI002456DF91
LQGVQQLLVVSHGEAGERRWGRGADLRHRNVLVKDVEQLVEQNVLPAGRGSGSPHSTSGLFTPL